MNRLNDQHVLVLGLGVSGLSMARWCARAGARVTVADTREAPPGLHALRSELPDARFVHGEFVASLVEGSDLRAVFASPGLAPEATKAVMDAASTLGLWTGGELDLFAQALADLKADRRYAPAVLAVTGTNGKTTVTALTGQLVARSGKRVAVAGNIGPALLDTLAAALDDEPAQAMEAADGAGETEVVAIESAGAEAPAVGAPAADGLAAEQTAEEAPAEQVPAEEAPAEEAPSEEVFAREELVDDTPAVSNTPGVFDDDPLPFTPPVVEVAATFVALPEVWVIELSSFQLHGVRGFEPTAATVLNITQDHLDWHGDMAAYAADKARIFGGKGMMLLNREDPLVMGFQPAPPKGRVDKNVRPREVVTFGGDMPQRPGDWGIETVNGMTWLVRALEADETRRRRKDEAEEIHIQRLMPADALRIRGRHNATNALAALALATAAGCALGPMLYGLRDYRGEPHRVEPVGLVNGVEYFDDSKGTNVGATVAALLGLGAERRVVVILGGEGKGQDFGPLAAPLARHARAVVLIGRDAPLIRAAIEAAGVPTEDATDMADAVRRASERAHPGDGVLMSPACASFDMFDNYKHRGQVFREAVAAVADEAGVPLEGTV